MTDFFSLSDGQAPLKPASVKEFRGIRLPGAELHESDSQNYSIAIHSFNRRLFGFSLRTIHCITGQLFTVKETSSSLRFETMLTGELNIREDAGDEIRLTAGQYRISDTKRYQIRHEENSGCQYLVAFISPELLSQIPNGQSFAITTSKPMTLLMKNIINRIPDNPFEEKFREGFYDYSIRKLLFYHISTPPFILPGELTPAEMAAVYGADNIIAANLSIHYTIHELAKMTRTNVYALKTGFARLFGMGPFKRLQQRKLDRAKYLLETTDEQIQVIADLAGYETVTGFINSFRKVFGMPPKDWRKKSRGLL